MDMIWYYTAPGTTTHYYAPVGGNFESDIAFARALSDQAYLHYTIDPHLIRQATIAQVNTWIGNHDIVILVT